MTTKKFELIPHTADMKLRVFGATQAELFKHALIGMFQSIGPKAPDCRIENDLLICHDLPKFHQVMVEAHDVSMLLVDFLSRALYLSDIYNEAYLDVTMHEITPTRVMATLYGIQVTGFEVVEIKAVTYHDLEVKQVDGTWQADIVFDI